MFSFSGGASVWFRRVGVFVGLVLVACVLTLPSLSSDARGGERTTPATEITVVDTTDSTTTTKTTKTTGGSNPSSREVSTVNPSGGEGFQGPDDNPRTNESSGQLYDCSPYLADLEEAQRNLNRHVNKVKKAQLQIQGGDYDRFVIALPLDGYYDHSVNISELETTGRYLAAAVSNAQEAYDWCMNENAAALEAQERQ